MIGSSNDETNFPDKLLLTNTQISKIRKAFANSLSANIEFSKTELFRIVQSVGFLLGSPIDPGIPSNIFTKQVEELCSFLKSTSKNMGGKKLKEDDLVNLGLNIIGKKIKKGISSITSSGISLRNN